jgi:hypothetical protein
VFSAQNPTFLAPNNHLQKIKPQIVRTDVFIGALPKEVNRDSENRH